MPVVAMEDARVWRRERPVPLSQSEKAMLFDLALAAQGSGRELFAAAPLLEALARAYVTIRDREDGIV